MVADIAVQLDGSYCLPSLLYYGCEVWETRADDVRSASVAWNNRCRKIFNACWRESVRPLLIFCSCLPLTYIIHQFGGCSKVRIYGQYLSTVADLLSGVVQCSGIGAVTFLIYWKKCLFSDNVLLQTLARFCYDNTGSLSDIYKLTVKNLVDSPKHLVKNCSG